MNRFHGTDGLASILTLIMLITGVVAGCDNGSDQPDLRTIEGDIQELTYRFGDASVPPEYHRSYSVSVGPGKARIVVDSYGDILAEGGFDVSSEPFEALVASLVKNDIRACKLRANDGCTGGTTESIVASGGDSVLFSASVYHCGGESSGDLCGDIKGFTDDLRRFLPDLEQLLDQS